MKKISKKNEKLETSASSQPALSQLSASSQPALSQLSASSQPALSQQLFFFFVSFNQLFSIIYFF